MPGRPNAGMNDLQSQFPEIAAEFDLELNAPNSPQTVTASSGKSFFWICRVGHSYTMKVANRTIGKQQCPFCANKRVLPGFNDLESQRPEVASWWDLEANDGLLPSQVYFGSTKKVFWRCYEGHLFQSSIRGRTERGTGCPVCANLVVLEGFNDLATTHPEIAAQWDYEANGPLTPSEVIAGSEKKVFWKCQAGHSYLSIPHNRVKGSGCTVCSGQTVQVGLNDLATTRPALAQEWDYQKNGDVTPQQVTEGSNRKFSWVCGKGHTFQATVVARSSRRRGCAYCAGQKVLVGFNDLVTTHPELSKKWDYDKNLPARPEQFSIGTTKKVYWLCEKGHSHLGSINSKAKGNGCPVCADQQVLAGYNDLGTLYPEIAAEWDYKKNAPATPREVLRGTARKYFWICPAGHSFQQTVLSRTYGGSGCPQCAKYGYDATRPGILYFIKSEKLRARKIGITNEQTGVRYDRIRSYGPDWKVVETFSSEDGYKIRQAELAVLDWIRNTLGLGQYLSREEMGSGGGHTETFSLEGPTDNQVMRKILDALGADRRGI